MKTLWKPIVIVTAGMLLVSGCAIFDTAAMLHPKAAEVIERASKVATAETAEAVEQICNRVDQASIDNYVAMVNEAADEGDVFLGIACAE